VAKKWKFLGGGLLQGHLKVNFGFHGLSSALLKSILLKFNMEVVSVVLGVNQCWFLTEDCNITFSGNVPFLIIYDPFIIFDGFLADD